MKHVQISIILLKSLLSLLFVAGLSGCVNDYGTPLIGTWKDTDQNRYISIEKNTAEITDAKQGGMGDANAVKKHGMKKSAPEFTVVMYLDDDDSPGRHGNVNDADYVPPSQRPNSYSMVAEMEDGILIIKVDEGEIPLLFNPHDERLYVNGVDEFRRI